MASFHYFIDLNLDLRNWNFILLYLDRLLPNRMKIGHFLAEKFSSARNENW